MILNFNNGRAILFQTQYRNSRANVYLNNVYQAKIYNDNGAVSKRDFLCKENKNNITIKFKKGTTYFNKRLSELSKYVPDLFI